MLRCVEDVVKEEIDDERGDERGIDIILGFTDFEDHFEELGDERVILVLGS